MEINESFYINASKHGRDSLLRSFQSLHLLITSYSER